MFQHVRRGTQAWQRVADSSGKGAEITTTRTPSSRLRPRLAKPAWAIALLFIAVAAAPNARAESHDDPFLTALASKGIKFASPQGAVTAAHEVCDELSLGRAKSDVANEVMQNSNLDGYHAGYFVGASVAAYCSKYAG
jgi:hypothetical protein